MAKEAYFFSHDSNARNDDKIIALRMRLKAEGYGIYFMILERLRDSSDYMSIKDYNMLAFDFRVSADTVKSVVEDFGLFSFTEDGKRFYSESFLKRMKQKDEKSEKARESANKRWEEHKQECERNANASIQECERNAIKEKKGKENKEKEINLESKDSLDELAFETVWAMYEKKGTSKVSRSKWDKLPKYKKQLALNHIPLYVQATPNKRYRKNFETYINQEAWNDEIFTFDQNQSSDLGEGVWVENGKKYYGDKNNPREIPMSAPKRPGKQYAYDREKNNWTIL